MGLTYDNGDVTTLGRYSGGAKVDHDEIGPGTYSYEWPATDAQIDQIVASMQKGPYLGIAGNCINGLERGLEVLGVEHPSFKEYGIALPTKAVIWLESLNGRSDFANALQQNLDFAADPDAYMARRENKPQLPVVTRKAGDVGGVS